MAGRQEAEVGIGLIGAGFAAAQHARAYRSVRGVKVNLVAVCSRDVNRAERFARQHGFGRACGDYRQVLDHPDVDVVDVCVPNSLHRQVVVEAALAGKEIICEKPLTAFCGDHLNDMAGETTARQEMLRVALDNVREMREAAERAGVRIMYAENWVYAPPIQKALNLACASGGAILDVRGEESHSGSHSPFSKRWKYTGGGAFIRLGAHPLGAALYLKRAEAAFHERPVPRPVSVTAEVGHLTRSAAFRGRGRTDPWLVQDWQDVEDWSVAVVTFSDGTKATIIATDVALGGIQNRLEVYLSNARIACNINPNSTVLAYAPDAATFESEYIAEKISTKAGWSFASPDEEWMQGYPQEIQNFVECAAFNMEPLSNAQLGEDVVKVIYSAYLAAERGARVDIA
jgi:predicted dehydrogenase